MNIKIGTYSLRSDSMQLWVEHSRPNENGKETITKVAGYSPDFKTLCESFFRHHYRCSGATEMGDFIKDMAKAEEETLKIIHGYFDAISEDEPEEDDDWDEDL